MSGADFLSGEQSEPLSGESQQFVNNAGYIGKVKAARLFQLSSVYSPTELGLSVQPVAFEKWGQKYFAWWENKDDALLAQEAFESKYAPGEVWYFVMRTDTIKNLPESSLAKMEREFQTGTCHTSMYPKYRHEMHLISLPAAVASFAKLQGYDVPQPNFDDLVSSDVQFTDQLMHTLIGDPLLNADETDEPLHYLKSAYGKQRASIWAALGESDPSKYTVEAGRVTDTTAKKLVEALRIVYEPWASSTWARVLFVPDPRTDAVSSSGNRLRVPVITEFFPNKAAAVKAGQVELTKRAERTDEADDGPAVPSDWDSDEWNAEMVMIREMLSKNGATSPKAKRLAVEKYIEDGYEEGEFAATSEDVLNHL